MGGNGPGERLAEPGVWVVDGEGLEGAEHIGEATIAGGGGRVGRLGRVLRWR